MYFGPFFRLLWRADSLLDRGHTRRLGGTTRRTSESFLLTTPKTLSVEPKVEAEGSNAANFCTTEPY
jgi:hypothetical protein